MSPSGTRGRLSVRSRSSSGVGGAAAPAGRRVTTSCGAGTIFSQYYRVTLAPTDGEEGLRLARAARPDRERRADARDVGNGAVRRSSAISGPATFP